MSPEEAAVFVVCDADSVEAGGAKAFSLSRIHENGEARPFPIVILRTHGNDYFGYVNTCPHQGTWLNFGSGEFFTPDRAFLKCGRHGARFEIDSGQCIDGPCEGKGLEPIALAVVDGEICLCGIALVEDDGMPDPFAECEETIEIMIHPD